MVNEAKLWKDRIEGELNVAAEWEVNWGFLCAEKKEEAPPEGRGLLVSRRIIHKLFSRRNYPSTVLCRNFFPQEKHVRKPARTSPY